MAGEALRVDELWRADSGEIDAAGYKLSEGKGLREGWDSKELGKSVEKSKAASFALSKRWTTRPHAKLSEDCWQQARSLMNLVLFLVTTPIISRCLLPWTY